MHPGARSRGAVRWTVVAAAGATALLGVALAAWVARAHGTWGDPSPASIGPGARAQVFWVDPIPLLGGMWSGPADGSGPARKIHQNALSPDGLAIDAAHRHIYFTNMSLLDPHDASVQRGELLDGRLQRVMDIVPEGWGLRTPKQIKLDLVRRHVYFADREGRRIYRAPMDGCRERADLEVLVDFTSLPETAHQFVGVEIDAERQEFYWSDRLTNTIWRAPSTLREPVTPVNLSQHATRIVSYPIGMVTDLALDARRRLLYWADRGEGNELIGATLPAGFIARIALEAPNASVEHLVSDVRKDPVGLALSADGQTLFYGHTEDGRVFSLSLRPGAQPRQLHRSLMGAGIEVVGSLP